MPRPVVEGTETILVVDDEQPIRLTVRAILQYRGYKVIEAISGEEGLQKFRAAPQAPDLVLLDLDMPGWDGWETLAQLRQLKPCPPVLLLSGGAV